MKLDKQLNQFLAPPINQKWDELLKADSAISMLPLEAQQLIKSVFHYGFQEGYEDNFQELKAVYNGDRQGFLKIFEGEDE